MRIRRIAANGKLIASQRPMRRGLAPLEMILCLPFLLLIMALIVNFATAASWKLRSLTVGRYAAYLSRWPRMARNSNFAAADWQTLQTVTLAKQFPQPNTVDSSHGSDRYLNLTDPRQGHEVVAGPSVTPSSAFGGAGTALTVDDGLLDFSAGIWDGTTSLNREFPFKSPLPNWASISSSYAFNNLRHPIIENQLEFHRMGLDHNERRRSWNMFDLDQNYSPRNDAAVSATESKIGLNNAVFDIIEHDWELVAYNRAIMMDPMSTKPLVNPQNCNFYPNLHKIDQLGACGSTIPCTDRFCNSTYSQTMTDAIESYKNRVRNLKQTMQTEFDKLYQ